MQDFLGKKIVLGICGGVAAYKTAFLVRELTGLGAVVRVVMTQSAHQFITPLTLQALSGEAVRDNLFDATAERAMGHIELARWADYFVVAPATANCLAKLAHGYADDLLTTLFLVCEAPIFLCPAMNQSMWSHPAVVENCRLLHQRGVRMVGPEEGMQACGEFGYGRMAEPQAIIDALRLSGVHNLLLNRSVLVTAGPTCEAIDPVRFISNRSSGKMGYALATAAQRAGAEVTLISGPSALTPPLGVHFKSVQSARDMHAEVLAHLKPGMIFMGCAAVADYRVATPATQKIKKQAQAQEKYTLELQENPDIIRAVVATGLCAYVLGFAAETDNYLQHARHKLEAKQLDMIVANQVGETQGFDVDEQAVTLITKQYEMSLEAAHKMRLAEQIIAILVKNMHNTAV